VTLYYWATDVHNNTASLPAIVQCSVAPPGEHEHRIVIDFRHLKFLFISKERDQVPAGLSVFSESFRTHDGILATLKLTIASSYICIAVCCKYRL
jgi:hypothetical protein